MDAAFPRAFSADYLGDEARLIHAAADRAQLTAEQAARVQALAQSLVTTVRAARRSQPGLDAFLQQYSLSSKEGVVLLCLAESLLRIPDAQTADRLIAEKIRAGDWGAHAGESVSLFVNATTWSLMLTGHIVRPEEQPAEAGRFVQRLVTRLGEPVVRAALGQAMSILGTQFVMGRSIGEALRRAREETGRRWRYSFDMLGEAALTWAEADRYYDEYLRAIDAIAVTNITAEEAARAGVSLKLSALHPRLEPGRAERAAAEVLPRVLELAQRAADLDVPLTIDAEEAERLELMLAVVRGVVETGYLEGWRGFGLAVQAYQRRAPAVLEWLIDLAARNRRRLNIRLVKGAYWDSEIKLAQQRGLAGYPVYTRKAGTDVAWLACARRLIAADPWLIQPQFATHNAHAVAWVMAVAGEARRDFEFQRLHGMGRELYAAVDAPCRVYAPVGSHAELLPYLVRRLLENGANTSFVHRLVDEHLPVGEVVRDPVPEVRALASIPDPRIPAPPELYGAQRRNSSGLNFGDSAAVAVLRAEAATLATRRYRAGPLIAGVHGQGAARPVLNPARNDDVVGTVNDTRTEEALAALGLAAGAFPAWEATPAAERARLLRQAADAFEAQRVELMSLCVREAGKTWPNALAEVREAVDYLRYYAARAEADFAAPVALPGPTGERNELRLQGRGPFVCISPWNFPLAIFTGQVAAALAAGNTVLAKPAEQTPLVAARAVELLHEAGIAREVLAYLPGDGATLGRALLADPRVAGVAFTGSTEVAQLINRQLAARDGPIAALIAETGGQNVMLADSSALLEQMVLDVAASAFDSAGQRCSAARVLLLQQDIAERTIGLLRGYMETLLVGDPALLETDVGPVIDAEARAGLEAHVGRLAPSARWLQRAELPEPAARRGHYFAPVALEIDSLAPLRREVFGPVLHVVRYRAADLDATIDAINALGYGLTLGVQTRIDATARRVAARARVGNVYVNRNMIGAVVGVQPFGGLGLSGTGPKAGGPHYLHRFATERCISTNTAAVGGNASLLSPGNQAEQP
ncbi:MAG TPA: bifunctional proline dehydrogenase/L-glutamate gamma-semialdehyde dehydrogenase PutA [Steroidobacteraceae bacterium]|nr:bifunctional proline dehydrogenase/L-glutamate gamma-semialdehyde dehydrogenase PutA [Steroidobacteraceae bacterium]